MWVESIIICVIYKCDRSAIRSIVEALIHKVFRPHSASYWIVGAYDPERSYILLLNLALCFVRINQKIRKPSVHGS